MISPGLGRCYRNLQKISLRCSKAESAAATICTAVDLLRNYPLSSAKDSFVCTQQYPCTPQTSVRRMLDRGRALLCRGHVRRSGQPHTHPEIKLAPSTTRYVVSRPRLCLRGRCGGISMSRLCSGVSYPALDLYVCCILPTTNGPPPLIASRPDHGILPPVAEVQLTFRSGEGDRFNLWSLRQTCREQVATINTRADKGPIVFFFIVDCGSLGRNRFVASFAAAAAAAKPIFASYHVGHRTRWSETKRV